MCSLNRNENYIYFCPPEFWRQQQRMYGNIFYDRGGECVKWREEHLILATKDTMVVSDIHNFFITLWLELGVEHFTRDCIAAIAARRADKWM